MRLIDSDDMIKSLMDMTFYDAEGETIHDYEDRLAIVKSFVDSVPTVDAVEVIRCEDCIHRPTDIDDEGDGYDIEFPDEVCPCQCDDKYFSWMPKDDWYCPCGERKEGEDEDS